MNIMPSEIRLQNDLRDMKLNRLSCKSCITKISDIIKDDRMMTFTMKISIFLREGPYKNQTFEVMSIYPVPFDFQL